jgi:hypothetical protein
MAFWSKFMDNRWEHNRLHGFTTNRCYYFSFSKKQNGNKMIWLRSTGSTISQLFDSFIVGIAFDDW